MSLKERPRHETHQSHFPSHSYRRTFASAQDWAKAALEKSSRTASGSPSNTVAARSKRLSSIPNRRQDPRRADHPRNLRHDGLVQDLADQVAAAGYIAVAPDLLSGMGPNGGRSSDFAEGKAMEAISHLNPTRRPPI